MLLGLHWVYWTIFFTILLAPLLFIPLQASKQTIDSLYYPNIPFGLQLYEHVSDKLLSSEKNTILNSRGATVKVFSTILFEYPPFIAAGLGTGTYVTFKDKPYILTAAHMISDCKNVFFTTGFDESVACLDIAYFDENLDIALIEIEKPLTTKTAIELDSSINASKDYPIGEKIYYTGYPNDSGLLTIKGQIAGHTYDMFLLQSYAWHGASGSGIFNMDGDLIGVVSAIQVGYDGDSLELIGSIVYAAPIARIDFSLL